MGLIGKSDRCPLCNEKMWLGNAAFRLNNAEKICTKCVVLLSGVLKTDQAKLKDKSIEELQAMREALTNAKQDEEKEKQTLSSSFNATRALSDILLVDENNRLFARLTKKPVDIYSIDSITGYELVENGISLSSGGLGRAVVGGLLFGGTGAIIGAVTGRKKTSELVYDLKIKLTTNDLNNPVIYISLINKPIKSNTAEYRGRIEAADTVLSSLDILLKK